MGRTAIACASPLVSDARSAEDYRVTGVEVVSAKADGSGVQEIAPDLGRSIESARFTPDGESLIVTYTSEGKTRVARVRAGRATEDLTDDVGGGGCGGSANAA